MMTIYLNKQPLCVSVNANLQQILLIGDPDIGSRNVAAVVNQNIIPKSEWLQHRCHNQDQIELFTAVAGG